MQNTTDSNKLIAAFKNIKYQFSEDLTYHNDWNELIKVIDFITVIEQDKRNIIDLKLELWMFLINDIDAAYNSVVEFITEYNKTKK